MGFLQGIKKNQRLFLPFPYDFSGRLHKTLLISLNNCICSKAKIITQHYIPTLARDIGLEKHWSKCISDKAILHLSACIVPFSESIDKFELPYMYKQLD